MAYGKMMGGKMMNGRKSMGSKRMKRASSMGGSGKRMGGGYAVTYGMKPKMMGM